MIGALEAFSGGKRFTADKLAASALETSELSPSHLHSLAEGEEDESTNAPQGTRVACKTPSIEDKCFLAP